MVDNESEAAEMQWHLRQEGLEACAVSTVTSEAP
jgi:hypothetical protein